MYQVCYWYLGKGPWHRFKASDYRGLEGEFSTVDEAISAMKERMQGKPSFPVAVFKAGDTAEPLVIVYQQSYPLPSDLHPETPRILPREGFTYREPVVVVV